MRNFITSVTSVAVCALFLSLPALAQAKQKLSDAEMNKQLM
jgi:hypothetical protein